jgi:hypothetical protein
MSDENNESTQPVQTGRGQVPVDPTAVTQRVSINDPKSTRKSASQAGAKTGSQMGDQAGSSQPRPISAQPGAASTGKMHVPVSESQPPGEENDPVDDAAQRKPRRWPIVLVGILLMLVLGAGGGFLGYQAARTAQRQAYDDSVTALATEQFMLGLQAQSEERFDLARQHFEYVIQLDPNFPGVKEKLTEVMIAAASAKTPTPQATLPPPTPTPTPDFRGEEEIFNNARGLLANKEWVQALQVLDTLRDKNLSYRAVEMDGMYYVALRHRGLVKISSGELEGGLYDLALVERFGPLDVDAEGVRTWARLYLTGSRFWGVRWDKVVAAFAEIYPAFPSMFDSSGMTATERFRIASIKYGDQLAAESKACEALQQYQNAQAIVSDSNVEPTVTAVYATCFPPTPTTGATMTPTPTATWTTGPSPMPTEETPQPSESPTDTAVTPSPTS